MSAHEALTWIRDRLERKQRGTYTNLLPRLEGQHYRASLTTQAEREIYALVCAVLAEPEEPRRWARLSAGVLRGWARVRGTRIWMMARMSTPRQGWK